MIDVILVIELVGSFFAGVLSYKAFTELNAFQNRNSEENQETSTTNSKKSEVSSNTKNDSYN